MNGLVGQGLPVILLRRKVLPPSEVRSCGLVPIAASPVPTSRAPLLAISRRQPPCRPLSAGIPVSRVRDRVAAVAAAFRRHATTLTSCPPPAAGLPWQV